MTDRLRSIFSTRRYKSWFYLPIIRLMVGWVFVLAGLQKFLFPQEMGAGRFADLGIPFPELMGPFVGSVELIGGLMVLLGAFTRIAAVPLGVVMIFALALTKVTVFANEGIIQGLHDSRLDITMLLGAIYLVLAGGGPWSVDRVLATK